MANFTKAKFWTGSSWLLTLSLTLIAVIVIYLVVHGSKPKCNCSQCYYKGREYIQLDKLQMQDVNNLLGHYPDSAIKKKATAQSADTNTGQQTATGNNQQAKNTDVATDSLKVIGAQKTKMLMDFLENEYDGQLDNSQKNKLDSLLVNLDTRDATTYLAQKKFKVCSYFFLVGAGIYIEVLFWSVIGVLCSLIYYVSIANRLQLRPEDGDTTVSPFDVAMIPGQAAKLLYAPISTLILVLGYSFIRDDNTMIDISMGKGVLLFSFIAGFYSGRVMKFLDKLKDLLLPVSSVEDSKKNTTTAGKPVASVTATLKLAPSLAQTEQGTAITEAGFNAAKVVLTSEDGKTIVELAKPVDDQSDAFTAEKAPFGKYLLKATLVYEHTDATTQQKTILNLQGSNAVEIKEATQALEITLDKSPDAG